MLSLELAKRLKEAGLKPSHEDYQHIGSETYWIAEVEEVFDTTSYAPTEDDVWLPRLDQLLGEIERHKCGYNLYTLTPTYQEHTYCCAVKLLECACGYRIDNVSWGPFKADNPEDAAAEALLWILQQGKGANKK